MTTSVTSVVGSDLAAQARRAVVRSCRQGVHPPCIVLGYFDDLHEYIATTRLVAKDTLFVRCPLCDQLVRLV